MGKAQYAILRFAKYAGSSIGNIEAHNERTKEKYASNPDIDTERSRLNYHLIEPKQKYRMEVEQQIKEAKCRTRKDSIRLVEVFVGASPEFFAGRKKAEIKEFFQHALAFLKENQREDSIISAVVHLDEATPHMHVAFVPLTEDNRLCAKEIIGNVKKLTEWQDKFWTHMVKRYPELERGESASKTGQKHIPPRVYKEMAHLNKQRDKLNQLLNGVNVFNAKSRAGEINKLLDSYIPAVEQMQTQLKKYKRAFTDTVTENQELKKENEKLELSLEKVQKKSVSKAIKDMQLQRDYENAVELLEHIPKEILEMYAKMPKEKEKKIDRVLR